MKHRGKRIRRCVTLTSDVGHCRNVRIKMEHEIQCVIVSARSDKKHDVLKY